MPLVALKTFVGAGVYALYYTGDFAPYETVAARNADGKFQQPIYVGKAIPEGGRKGGGAGIVQPVGPYLYRRLTAHRNSIKKVFKYSQDQRPPIKNLKPEDFWCRYLVVEDIWIPLGESLMIASFSPVWNIVVEGFGNNAPGSGREKGMRPRWDVLHPGRPWADRCEAREETADQIAEEARQHLENHSVIGDEALLMTQVDGDLDDSGLA